MNKVDKIYKTTSILLLLLVLIPIVGFIIFFSSKELAFLIPIVSIITIISSIIIPIGNLILIATFFIKLFSKNKTGKNDKQLVLNLINIIFYSLVSLFCIAFLSLIFISDARL